MRMSVSRAHAVRVALVLALVGCVSEAPPTTTPPPVNNGMPALAYVTTDVRDDVTFSARNNGDGMAQPGESLQLVIKLRNSGTVTTTGVRAVVTAMSDYPIHHPKTGMSPIPNRSMDPITKSSSNHRVKGIDMSLLRTKYESDWISCPSRCCVQSNMSN